jgi:hypothetical protein
MSTQGRSSRPARHQDFNVTASNHQANPYIKDEKAKPSAQRKNKQYASRIPNRRHKSWTRNSRDDELWRPANATNRSSIDLRADAYGIGRS